MIPPPNSPLWHAVVREAGGTLDPVWPTDDEVAARALGTAWKNVSDQIGQAGEKALQANGLIGSSWWDTAGEAASGKVTAYFGRVGDVALMASQLGIMADSYAQTIEQAKTDVTSTISFWEQAYAAAGVPAFGKDTADAQNQVAFHAAQRCMLIIDTAADAIKNTLAKQAADAAVKRDKGALSAVRQTANAGKVLWKGYAEQLKASGIPGNRELAGGFDKVLKHLDRWGISAPLAGVGILYDIQNGKPVDQAIAAGGSGWAAATGVGVAAGTLIGGPIGAAVGALGGAVVGPYVAGVVDSMYEHGPTHLYTASKRGADNVASAFEGIGAALSGQDK